jgi:hypothetical protein
LLRFCGTGLLRGTSSSKALFKLFLQLFFQRHLRHNPSTALCEEDRDRRQFSEEVSLGITRDGLQEIERQQDKTKTLKDKRQENKRDKTRRQRQRRTTMEKR